PKGNNPQLGNQHQPSTFTVGASGARPHPNPANQQTPSANAASIPTKPNQPIRSNSRQSADNQ
ncbi:hypothetical protein, partial [Prosthecochloris sp. ZM_2]|uniref:hypothetical protein n=1 Tax=Prosthecochloris sp. ZM_2 TaxID=2045206 RepID=UPI001F475EF1